MVRYLGIGQRLYGRYILVGCSMRTLLIAVLLLTISTPIYGAISVVGPVPIVAPTAIPITAATTLPVSGSVTQGTSPWVVSTPPPTTTVTVTQATGTNLHAVLDAAAAIIGKVGIDQTTPGTTNLVNAKVCDTSTATQCAAVSAGGGVRTTPFLDGGGLSVQAIACSLSVAVNITTATTTEIVLVSGAKSIYVCGFTFDKSSASGTTFQFLYGTKTSTGCDTGATALTGAMDGAAAFYTVGGGLGTMFRTPASKELCITTVGASPSFQGFVSYGQF